MKKPKDITDLANRLASAASTPLVAPASPPVAPVEDMPMLAARPTKQRRAANRSTIPVFLRLSETLYDQYDSEAVRRTKETGRGVTVQQVILERLAGTSV
jgi:hypothetical protein